MCEVPRLFCETPVNGHTTIMSQVRGFRTTHIHSTRSVNIRILGRRREWMTLGVVKRLTSLEGSIPSSSATAKGKTQYSIENTISKFCGLQQNIRSGILLPVSCIRAK
jgi:hypothetical protein